MNRVIGHLAVLVVLGLSALHGAQASDIDCKSASGAGSVRCEDPQGNGMRCALETDGRPRNKHLVCDNAELSTRYERIYAEQQKLLHSGVTNDADVRAWRSRRDACGSVRCLDSLFHEWWRWRDAARMKPARPAVAPGTTVAPSTTVAAPVPPKQEPTPPARDQATPAQLAATVPESAKPSEPASPAAAGVQAPPTSPGTGQVPSEPASANVVLSGLLAGLAAVGIGAAWLWKRKRERRASLKHERRRVISAGMAILYGLLIVNVLLLAFTLRSS
ncbi:GntR family transcriptional regulator [Cupriavidus basilensis]|uniref:GntR family transcriptional regulator n=1 Tax=Cupriavidus basilensis TaxID=68895 RepID=UPI0020A6A60B|nr:GntR family transcriptional regulator [Cupriavidus basilensis]MCP3022905.1 GntR family transcriptional regulator [Cupriavidus basilensis]